MTNAKDRMLSKIQIEADACKIPTEAQNLCNRVTCGSVKWTIYHQRLQKLLKEEARARSALCQTLDQAKLLYYKTSSGSEAWQIHKKRCFELGATKLINGV